MLKVPQKMIAANLRKFPDAMIRQMELDLAGIVAATPEQRTAAWDWLMATAKVRSIAQVIPAWVRAAHAAAKRLAKAIKAACLKLVE